MATTRTRLLEMGFGRPSGPLGRLGAALMARGNGPTERQMVEEAKLGENDDVLVLGPGPGVGLRAAGLRSRHVVGVDPAPLMLAASRRRCLDLVDAGRVRLVRGDAERTGRPDGSTDVVIAVNNVQIWPDWPNAFGELRRVLRPGGRLLLSTHRKWLPGGLGALTAAVDAAGFDEIEAWTWEPGGRAATTATQLSARRATR